MPADACILLDTAGLNSFTRARFEQYRNAMSGICEVYAVVHHPDAVRATDHQAKIVYLTNEQIFNEVEHSKDVSRGLIPGNLDLKKIRSVREVPSYSRYIWIEYDVLCTSDFRSVVQNLLRVTEEVDFAASFILPRQSYNDDWMWWDSLKIPAELGLNASDIAVRAFLPLFVFSYSYILEFEKQLRLGWAGHSEVTMSTIASLRGFKMLDISRSDPPFTQYPQFNVVSLSGLEKNIPPFIHPVKDPKSQMKYEEIIRALRG